MVDSSFQLVLYFSLFLFEPLHKLLGAL